MPKFLLVAVLSLSFSIVDAQEPVQWTTDVKKLDKSKYEVIIKAAVAAPWHIYSQHTPDGGPLPTKITFRKNPVVELVGFTKEEGKLVSKYEDVFDVDVKYFEADAAFRQVVKVKAGASTNISGTIEFMACNDQQCLPPATVPFQVSLK